VSDGRAYTADVGRYAIPGVYKQRIQLADLPASPNTNTQFFSPTVTVAANRPVRGALVYVNDIDAGASGITAVNMTFGFGTLGPPVRAMQIATSVDVLGTTPSGGLPGYITPQEDPASYYKGPLFVLPVDSEPFYSIQATGGNLNTLAAFDVTVLVFPTSMLIDVP
jgi:hypothetical protein